MRSMISWMRISSKRSRHLVPSLLPGEAYHQDRTRIESDLGSPFPLPSTTVQLPAKSTSATVVRTKSSHCGLPGQRSRWYAAYQLTHNPIAERQIVVVVPPPLRVPVRRS